MPCQRGGGGHPRFRPIPGRLFSRNETEAGQREIGNHSDFLLPRLSASCRNAGSPVWRIIEPDPRRIPSRPFSFPVPKTPGRRRSSESECRLFWWLGTGLGLRTDEAGWKNSWFPKASSRRASEKSRAVSWCSLTSYKGSMISGNFKYNSFKM